jgi:hypothetical protein
MHKVHTKLPVLLTFLVLFIFMFYLFSYLITVKPLSIVPVTVVAPHVLSALFGPEISPI